MHDVESISPHLHSGCISSGNSTSPRATLSPAFVQQTDLFFSPRQSRAGVWLFITWSEHLIPLLYIYTQTFPPALTITVDSYFWNRYPLWPEFSSIYFNVVEGKSAEWGVRTFSPTVDSLVLNPYPLDLPSAHLYHLVSDQAPTGRISPVCDWSRR